jgi:hypothetical protein
MNAFLRRLYTTWGSICIKRRSKRIFIIKMIFLFRTRRQTKTDVLLVRARLVFFIWIKCWIIWDRSLLQLLSGLVMWWCCWPWLLFLEHLHYFTTFLEGSLITHFCLYPDLVYIISNGIINIHLTNINKLMEIVFLLHQAQTTCRT